jgi:hypothetical protein
MLQCYKFYTVFRSVDLAMPTTSVVRIDNEVRAELQRMARPFDDTPNLVLRRLLGLPEPPPRIEPRVGKLLEALEELIHQSVKIQPDVRGYAVMGKSDQRVAYIRPQKERIRIAVTKENARIAKLSDWANERQDRDFFCISARWYVPDSDNPARDRVAAVLGQLWMADQADVLQV